MMSKLRGFSLIEVMIVLVIISIIAMIAFPSYQDSVRKSRRTDGKSAVMETVALQEKHYFQFSQYAATPAGIAGCDAGCATSPEGYYTVSITQPCGTNACFTVTATATGDQAEDDNCASFSVAHTGLKSAVDSGGNDATANCW